MDSIAVTKPHMGVLSQERLPLSPFGVLAQSFAEELLARGKQEEGRWSFVPLELLEEENEPLPQPPTKLVFQVDLQLVLDALRREGSRTEQQRTTERIVERVLRLQKQHEEHTSSQKRQENQQSLTVLGTIHQEFHQNLIQNISVSTPAPSRPGNLQAPGALARQAEAFSRQLQALREEGKSFAPVSTMERTDTVQSRTTVPLSAGPFPAGAHPAQTVPDQKQPIPALSQEILTLLEEQGTKAVQGTDVLSASALIKAGRQLEKLAAELPLPVQSSHRKGTASTRTATASKQSPASTSDTAPTYGGPGKAARSHPGSTHERKKSPLPPALDAEQQVGAGSTDRGAIRQAKGAHIPSGINFDRPTQAAPPSTRVLHTTAEDIRVSTEDPSHASERTSSLPTQPPAELSHPTQAGEHETKLSTQAQHPAQSVQVPLPVQRSVKQQSGAKGDKAEDLRLTPSSAPRSHGVSGLTPSARDIRLSTEFPHDDAQEYTTFPAPSPAELSFLSQAKGQEADIPQQRQNPVPTGQVPFPDQPSAKQQAGAEIGKATDPRLNPSSAPRSHSVSGLTPSARDIRLSTEFPHDDAQEHTTFPAPSPAELSFLSQAKGQEADIPQQRQNPVPTGQVPFPGQPSAKQQAGAEVGKVADPRLTPSSAPRSHGVSGLTSSVRDIRLSNESRQDDAQEHTTLPAPYPTELSLLSQAESQETDIPQQRQNPVLTGQVPFPDQPSAKQQAGAEVGKATDPRLNPSSAPRSHGVSGLMSSVRDIRLSNESRQDDAQEHTTLPAPYPTELSLLSQAESQETDIPQQRQNSTRTSQVPSPVQSSSKQRTGMETEKPAEPQLSPSSAPRSHGVSVLTSSARDIRASAADRSNGSPEKQLHSVPSPAELSHRTPAETPGSLPEQSMQVSVGQMEWKKQNPISSALVYTSDGSHPRTIPMTQPTVKDIRRTAVSPHEKAAGNLRAPSGGVTAPNTSSVEAAKAEQNRTPTQIPVPTDLILAQSGAFPLEPAAPMSRSETHVGGQDAQVVSPPEPTTLTYGPAQRQTEAGSPASATAEQAKPGESPFVRSLPDWARRFLASGTDSGSATQTMGVARSITSLPQPEPEESIQWSAPNFRPPEAQIAYRQKEKGETAQETTEVRISDADLQRAADRVYHMIEDRIRRERRRLGL